jgi:hypothetical protein
MTIKKLSSIKETTTDRHHGNGMDRDESIYFQSPVIAKLKSQHKHEKNRLQTLNARLEDYLRKVKQLESDNDSLINSIREIKHDIGSSSHAVKDVFDLPLKILKNSLNAEVNKELIARLKMRNFKYLTELMRIRLVELTKERRVKSEKLEKLSQLNEALKTERQLLREKYDRTVADVDKGEANSRDLTSKLQQLNDQLDETILDRVKQQVEKQRIAEEIDFNKAVHLIFKQESERINSVKQNRGLLNADYYKRELLNSIERIRQDFSHLAQVNKTELREYFESRVTKAELETEQQVKAASEASGGDEQSRNYPEEVKILKNFHVNFSRDLSLLRSRNVTLESKFKEKLELLDMLRDRNRDAVRDRESLIENLRQSLREKVSQEELESGRVDLIRNELKIYENLLNIKPPAIISAAPAAVVEPIYVVNTKVKNSKEIKGAVGIKDVSVDSKCIVIENMSERNEYDLSRWYLERFVDGSRGMIRVSIPDGVRLEPKSRVNLWTGDCPANVQENLKSDIVYREIDDWGKGTTILTRLFDANSEIKSIHTQKFIY